MTYETELSKELSDAKDQIEDMHRHIGCLNKEVSLLGKRLDFANKDWGKQIKLALFWHGKFAIVKLENNALRRKLNDRRESS